MAQMTYAYKVRDTNGKVVEGTLDADNQSLVASRLREMGYTPVNIKAKSAGGMHMEIRLPGIGNRVPLKEVALFSRQFATLISSGLTLIRSLTILTTQTENPALAKIVTDVRGQVERGVSLSQALSSHPKVFSRLFVAMVRAGEASGGLDQSLTTLSTMLERQAALRGKIKSAMAYPATVLCLVCLILTAMILFIVPVFKNIYTSLGAKLPFPTRMLISISDIAVKFAVPILVLVVIGVILLKRWMRTPQGKAVWDITILKVPIFGSLMRKTAIARFCATFSSLSARGCTGARIARHNQRDGQQRCGRPGGGVHGRWGTAGETMTARLSQHPIFPAMVSQMMSVGEETGALDAMLGRAAGFLEEEIERTVASLTSLLEPLMIVILGGCVGTMVVCLYLPMFKVDTLINGNN